MDDFTSTLLLSLAADVFIILACIAFVLSFGQHNRQLNFKRLCMAIFLALPIFILKAPLLLFFTPINVFGLIHNAYLDLVLILPGSALIALTISKLVYTKTKTPALTAPVRWLAALAVIICPAVGVYAGYIEPFRLQMEKTTLEVTDKQSLAEPVRIAVLPDFQTDRVTAYERYAIDMLLAQQPDIIVIPGDVFQGASEQLKEYRGAFRELFAKLKAPGGVYVAPGNCDHPAAFAALFDGLGNITQLSNKIVTTELRGQTVRIAGLADNDTSPAAKAIVAELEANPDDGAIRLLIAHRPDAVFLMQEHSPIDLLFAGHTHGGQICIPFFGPIMTLTNVPRDVAAGGLHELNGRRMYVSRGVGHERGQAPRIRFCCPPEIAVVTLQNASKTVLETNRSK